MKVFLALACALALAGGVRPADAAAPKVISPTRGMVVFSGLEATLDKALRAHDQAVLDTLLAGDFEVRESAAPGEPVTRERWLARPVPPAPLRFEGMSVHDLGEVAVVSFATPLRAGARASFLVDVWRRDGGQWRLQVRYQPGSTPAPTRSTDRAPTGKG